VKKNRWLLFSLLQVYKYSESHGVPTYKAADRFCEERLEARKKRNSMFAHSKRPKWDIRN
ncbi:hypothetical protein, partial [Streptomyces gulbargensis]|uniref:hypothetical protein n=1 Tax=Streptomyces gulbargensis TaxID=364901 RepID=UPI0031EC6252